MNHLKARGYVEEDKIIDQFSNAIYSISSNHGVHVPNSRPEYLPTRYTVQALTFAILDQLLWFKGIVEKR
jgi:hypothetical protein